MIRLSSSSPVTAATTSGGRWIPARSSTWISVASPSSTWCSNSPSSCSKRSRRCSRIVTSCPSRSRFRATFAPTLPPPAIMMYTSGRRFGGLPREHFTLARGLEQRVDRGVRRADRPQAETLAVERRACGVEGPDDDALVVEPLLRDLRDHEVRVVAVGRDDDGVCVLARGLAKDVVDGGREEARLPAPVRRRAEDDQIGVALLRLRDDRVADRSRADGLAAHVDAVVGA